MNERLATELLLELLEGDRQLLRQLHDSGLVPLDDSALRPEHTETARVARTLVRELEVNWPGVEIILRMRAELVATRRQVAELVALMRRLT